MIALHTLINWAMARRMSVHVSRVWDGGASSRRCVVIAAGGAVIAEGRGHSHQVAVARCVEEARSIYPYYPIAGPDEAVDE